MTHKPVTRAQVHAIFRQQIAKAMAAIVEKMWTIQDVLHHLQVAERTFYRNRAKWNFPAPDINEGSFKRWNPETVRNWKKHNVTN